MLVSNQTGILGHPLTVSEKLEIIKQKERSTREQLLQKDSSEQIPTPVRPNLTTILRAEVICEKGYTAIYGKCRPLNDTHG